ncbi:MAG: putative collagen-binding domain-containing protein [Pirellulaceae bacterium]
MKPLVFLLSGLVIELILVAGAATAEPSLRPWDENSWYWSYGGKPVLLLGGSDDDNLFQWPEKQLVAQLDRLAKAGGNVIRNTMSDRKDKGFEVYPFKRLDNGKYDLNAWNDEYWQRFERMLRETGRRDIIVQIEIWDRFDYTDSRGSNRWQIHPYNPRNNVNYTYEESSFAKRYPDHPGANKQPFFFTTPKQRHNQVVLSYQQRFIDKLLDVSLKFEHVLYCIDNETNGEEEWGRYWATYVKQLAARRNKRLHVTEMWDDWNLTAERHKRTFDHPELYDFVDVSQNNHNKGQNHWDNFLHVRKYLAGQPRPMNTTKTYGATGNKFGHNDQDAIERFWRHLLAGASSIRFHRPDSGLGLNDKAVACLRAARKLESLVPLWSAQPANGLLSDRNANEAYLAADKGGAWAVYFPAGGEVRIDLSNANGPLIVHWINVDTGEYGPKQRLSGGGNVKLSPPGNENWAAAIVAQ